MGRGYIPKRDGEIIIRRTPTRGEENDARFQKDLRGGGEGTHFEDEDHRQITNQKKYEGPGRQSAVKGCAGTKPLVRENSMPEFSNWFVFHKKLVQEEKGKERKSQRREAI